MGHRGASALELFARRVKNVIEQRVTFNPASPPDVRRGSAPPYSSRKIKGAVPLVRPLAQKGKARTGGTAPFYFWDVFGGAEPRLTSGGEAVAKTTTELGVELR